MSLDNSLQDVGPVWLQFREKPEIRKFFFFFWKISRYVNLWVLFGQTEHQIVISLLGASQFSPEDHSSASMKSFRLAMRPCTTTTGLTSPFSSPIKSRSFMTKPYRDLVKRMTYRVQNHSEI